MTSLPNVRLFLRLMVNPGWAPIVVAAAFLAVSGTGLGARYDYVFHAAGGAAFAYFIWRCAALVPSLSKRVRDTQQIVFAFTGACLVAVLWEVAEFGADQWLGTTLQGGLLETLRDLAFGAIGAAVVCVLISLLVRRRQNQADMTSPDE